MSVDTKIDIVWECMNIGAPIDWDATTISLYCCLIGKFNLHYYCSSQQTCNWLKHGCDLTVDTNWKVSTKCVRSSKFLQLLSI